MPVATARPLSTCGLVVSDAQRGRGAYTSPSPATGAEEGDKSITYRYHTRKDHSCIIMLPALLSPFLMFFARVARCLIFFLDWPPILWFPTLR